MKNTALAASAFLAVDIFLIVYIAMLVYGFSMTSGACKALHGESRATSELAGFKAVCEHQTDPVSWLTLASGRLLRG